MYWIQQRTGPHTQAPPPVPPAATVVARCVVPQFKNGSFSYKAQHFNSLLSRDYHRCIFLGPGTGPTVGYKLCWQNPAVNVLPIADQLWATVDTAYWGRIDPETLQRVPGM